MPPGAYLLGKMLMAVCVAAVVGTIAVLKFFRVGDLGQEGTVEEGESR